MNLSEYNQGEELDKNCWKHIHWMKEITTYVDGHLKGMEQSQRM